MKSLSENYTSSHSNTHETFADLVFCALVVLVLFVVTLAVEVSQRVRAKLAETPVVPTVEIEQLSPEEVKELSERLQKQQAEMEAQKQQLLAQAREMEELRAQVASQEAAVSNKMAALSGEQRFTGATEPANLQVAFEYKQDRFLFIRQKEFRHAVTRLSGESDLAHALRSRTEMVELALASRKQRYYTIDETNRIYAAFTTYAQINPTEQSYTVSNEQLGVRFGATLSGYIAGDATLPDYASDEIEDAVNSNFNRTGEKSDAMYPSVIVDVDDANQRVTINGVSLSAKDFKDLLLAIGGRGVMLDFTGYSGAAPTWLVEEVLTPTGYIGKTPKLPSD